MNKKGDALPRTDNFHQQRLFHYSTEEVYQQSGLDQKDVMDLYANGLLSFDPSETESLNEFREDELRFIAVLKSSGMSTDFFQHLLRDLKFPYCYSHSNIYYDWPAQSWTTFPLKLSDMSEEDIVEWLKVRLDEGDNESLSTVIKEAIGSRSTVAAHTFKTTDYYT